MAQPQEKPPAQGTGWAVTLMATHGAADLSALCEDVARITGRPLPWKTLKEGVAYDATDSENLPAARRELEQLAEQAGADIVIQPAMGRKKPLFLSDMDSTIINQECIDEMAEMLGIGSEIAAITASAMRGDIPFETSLERRVYLLRGLPVSMIDEIYERRITLAAGAKELLSALRREGVYCALVSGGFTLFTGKVAADIGFDTHLANQLEVENGKLTGRVTMPVFGPAGKLEALERLALERRITTEDAIAAGDGANDLPMLRAAGMGVATHAKPAVNQAMQSAGKAVLRHTDLRGIAWLQGILTA